MVVANAEFRFASPFSQRSGRKAVGARTEQSKYYADAVVMNALLIHGLDYDDTHPAGVIHATTSVLPAALGLGARLGASGRELLAAYGLHAAVRFDAVAPFVGSERQLYEDLGTLLRDHRPTLQAVLAELDRDVDAGEGAQVLLVAAPGDEGQLGRAVVVADPGRSPCERSIVERSAQKASGRIRMRSNGFSRARYSFAIAIAG